MLAQTCADKILDFPGKIFAVPIGNDESFDYLAAERIGNPNRRRLAYIRVFEHGVFDLDRAHRPAGRDDHIVRATRMVEVAVFVDTTEILSWKPRAAAPHFKFAEDAGWAWRASWALHLDPPPRDRLAKRAGLDDEVLGPWIIDQDHPDLRGAVHATHWRAEGRLSEGE